MYYLVLECSYGHWTAEQWNGLLYYKEVKMSRPLRNSFDKLWKCITLSKWSLLWNSIKNVERAHLKYSLGQFAEISDYNLSEIKKQKKKESWFGVPPLWDMFFLNIGIRKAMCTMIIVILQTAFFYIHNISTCKSYATETSLFNVYLEDMTCLCFHILQHLLKKVKKKSLFLMMATFVTNQNQIFSSS